MGGVGKPPFVVHADDVEEQEAHYPEPWDGEALAFGRNLGGATGSRALGAWLDRLPPGRRTGFSHAHLREEEMLWVVSGAPTLQWKDARGDSQRTPLRAGSFVSLPAGTGLAHTILNDGDSEAVILVVGQRCAGERLAYPEDGAFEAWRRKRNAHRVWSDRTGPVGEARPPAYRIETERLVLRPWDPTDAPDLASLVARNHAHLAPWMPWAAKVPTMDEELELIRGFRARYDRGEDFVLGVFLPDGRPIGGTGLHPRVGPGALEVGYWIDEAHQGKGYVTEWVAALCRLALEGLGIQRIDIHCAPDNVRSSAIPQRLGFTLEATLRRRNPGGDGALRDTMIWTLVAEDLHHSAAATAMVKAWDGVGRRLV